MTLLSLFRDYVCIQEMYLSATIEKSVLGVLNFILDLKQTGARDLIKNCLCVWEAVFQGRLAFE